MNAAIVSQAQRQPMYEGRSVPSIIFSHSMRELSQTRILSFPIRYWNLSGALQTTFTPVGSSILLGSHPASSVSWPPEFMTLEIRVSFQVRSFEGS